MADYVSGLPNDVLGIISSLLDIPSRITFHLSSHSLSRSLSLVPMIRKKELMCGHAANNGHLSILKWAIDNGCVLDNSIISSVASGGSIEMVEWLKNRDHNLIESEACRLAAANGHLSMLICLIENGNECSSSAIPHAAFYGRLNIMKWLREEGYVFDCRVYYEAAKGGHLGTLKWLIENTQSGDSMVMLDQGAAAGGHIEVVKWLLENNYVTSYHMCDNATFEGQIHLIEWLEENGYVTQRSKKDMCSVAADAGHIETLIWLHERGYPLDESTLCCACYGGHLDIVKWLVENGCPYNKGDCVSAAYGDVVHGPENEDVIEYLESL